MGGSKASASRGLHQSVLEIGILATLRRQTSLRNLFPIDQLPRLYPTRIHYGLGQGALAYWSEDIESLPRPQVAICAGLGRRDMRHSLSCGQISTQCSAPLIRRQDRNREIGALQRRGIRHTLMSLRPRTPQLRGPLTYFLINREPQVKRLNATTLPLGYRHIFRGIHGSRLFSGALSRNCIHR